MKQFFIHTYWNDIVWMFLNIFYAFGKIRVEHDFAWESSTFNVDLGIMLLSGWRVKTFGL